MARLSLPRLAYRYASGQPLAGPGRPGGQLRRAAYRLTIPAASCAAWAAYQAEPTLTTVGLAGASTVVTYRVGRAARRRWRTRRFRAAYIRPTLAALRPALGDAPVRLHVDPSLGNLVPRLARPMSPAETAVRAWYGQRVEPVLRWLPDRVMRGAWALQRVTRPATARLDLLRRPAVDAGPRIELATAVPYLTVEQRQYVSAVVSAKIPAGELVESWDQVGARVTATWTVRRRPPAKVGYADLTARLSNLAEWEFFLGLGVGGRPVTVSLRDDSPHIAVSAGSGAGKSVLAQLVAVQVLARGGSVVILDRKGSHRWALGMPGVDYCTRPEQMHDALVRLAVLADQRNQAAMYEDEDWDPGPRTLVIAEELNATFAQLRAWWDETREKSDPKIPPAVRAFRELLFMGRSAKINVLAVAQMLTAQTTGGPESRENFGVRALARYTVNAWKMLVPEASMPRASRTLGRWQIVVGGTAVECQVCYLSAPEARLFVHKHAGVPASPDSPLMASTSHSSPGHGSVGDKIPDPSDSDVITIRSWWGHGSVGDRTPDPLTELVTLRAAAERGLVPWQHAAAKKRMQRGRAAGKPTVPAPAGRDGLADTYRVGELLAWVESELIP